MSRELLRAAKDIIEFGKREGHDVAGLTQIDVARVYAVLAEYKLDVKRRLPGVN